MSRHRVIRGLCAIVVLFYVQRTDSQTASALQSQQVYNLSVAVNEVSLTFHVADIHSLPVNDLKLDELKLLDNGQPPRRILVFQALRDLPIRAGIIMDTSQSMNQTHSVDQAIAIAYAQHILEQKADQAFVMSFDRRSQILQIWTNSPTALVSAILKTPISVNTTALFDTLYAACRYQFGKLDHAVSGNFILLFSDGDDDASYLSQHAAIDMCQQTNTAIYVFRTELKPGFSSTGPRILEELASQTGGRVFRDSTTDEEIYEDLRIIEANLRNQYRLVYNPAQLKRDGSFHQIVLLPPDRVATINIRSGYYAPTH